MVYRIPWMSGVDHLILDWLEENDVVVKPSILAVNLSRDLPEDEVPSTSQVRRRMKYLEREAGLLEQYGDVRGQYILSEKGWRFIEDNMSQEEREELAKLEPDQGGSS
jgi:hypothetical protein